MPKVTINIDVCKGCDLCAFVCPKKIIKLSTTKINEKGYPSAEIIEPESCIGCGFCAIMCPDSAITLEK